MKRKFLSVLLALVLVLSFSLVTAVPAGAVEVSSVFQSGGDRLVETQNDDGGWGFPLTGDSAANMIGQIGIGLAETYRQTNDADHHAALVKVGTFLLTKTNNFNGWDGYLAVQLDDVFGGTTYTDFVKTNFYDLLALGTYEGTSGTYDTEGYISYIGYAWSLGIGLVSAEAVGIDQSEVDKWIAGVKTAIDGLDVSGDLYYPSDLAGGIYGLAYAGVTEFSGDVGGTAMSSVADLAVELASLQAPSGAFRDGVELAQDTAYALLALNQVDSSSYMDNIIRAAAYLGNAQLGTGGWINGEDDPDSVGRAEINGMTAEALWALAYAPVRVTIGETGFYSIQAAINAATAGDTILVADGTYEESISVTTNNLTLRSENGRDSTIIENVGGTTSPEVSQSGFLIRGPANDFTLGGAADQGFTFVGGTAPRLIQLNNGPSGVEISYNTVNTTGTASIGIQIGAAGATGLTVSNNTFIADAGSITLVGPCLVDVTVTYNNFSGPWDPVENPEDVYTPAIYFSGVTASSSDSPSTISNNIITAHGRGILLENGDGTSNLLISGNNISNSYVGIKFDEGVMQGDAADITTVTVTENTLSTNTVGLLIVDGSHIDASAFTITCNNFNGNTTYGLENAHSTEFVTAENNYWGNASGPTHMNNPFGIGDAVTTIVDPAALGGLYGWLGELAGYLDDLRALSEFGEGADLVTYYNTFGDDILTLFFDLYGNGGVLDELGFDYPDGELNDLLFTFVSAIGDFRSDIDDFTNSVDPDQSLGVLGIIVDDISSDLGDFYGGLGEFSNTNVNYAPWLLEVVVEEETPTTFDMTLALKDGWTLVSSDKEVITGTTWAGTNDLSPEDPETVITVMGYGYALEGGVLVFGDAFASDLEPVSALYVKTDGGGGVGIDYSTGAPTASEKSLLDGWNLISSASWDNAYLVLSPLHYVQIGVELGPGLATLESQGDYNQFTHSFRLVTLTEGEWAVLRGIMLSPFDGYWVYMNAGKSFGVIPD